MWNVMPGSLRPFGGRRGSAVSAVALSAALLAGGRPATGGPPATRSIAAPTPPPTSAPSTTRPASGDPAPPPPRPGGRAGRMEKGAYLGVAAPVAPRAARAQAGLPEGVGLIVDAVAADSPAAAAGVRAGDVLHKLNDQVLVNPQQLAVLVRTLRPGDAVALTLARGGQTVTASATLVERDLRPLDEMRLGDPLGGERWADRFAPWRGGPARPAGPAGGRLLTEDYVWDDGTMSLNVRVAGGRRTLTARDRFGRELFEGPVDTAAERAALPPPIRDRLPLVGPPGLFPPDAPATRAAPPEPATLPGPITRP